MLIGPRNRERLAQNNSPLNEQQREEMFKYFTDYTINKLRVEMAAEHGHYL